jgi:4,5-dihydroxyphthalate decarboxylase
MSDGGVEPTPTIERLFPDYMAHQDRVVAAVGTVPVNSVIVVRDDVLAANPGLDRALTDAYHRAWLAYLDGTSADDRHMGLSIGELRSRGLFPPPRGFTAHRKAIRLLIHACYEQGLIRTLFEPEDIFAPID